ncbi:hypothetical protein CW751_11470 [Brumimicrobium salinarum]|uniref:Uncharacterized protein n=1 Tax=Brumimicrobium salinarum TaxID=2058658 RepID=A0A2I0R0M4_9FLAO|nr:hypothetical protein [Brumimicrobium salinarum]PKR80117.1 hypothetical protein CW751_11470 [Brumimicrobium salinarum]
MGKKEEIQKEINDLTNKIRDEKPGAYKHLMESPETIPNDQNKNSDDFVKSLEKYKNQLEGILTKDD